ncbi:MAG TPA: hypothetical protein VFR31_10340 [Thermoanaerobaculia bacterium]|nr:hypothetical protein [Thermoanaerobaculia bacterium]
MKRSQVRVTLFLVAILAAAPAMAAKACVAGPGSAVSVMGHECVFKNGKKSKPLEPSGIVWDGKQTLYMVSDNGIIAKKAVSAAPTDSWTCIYPDKDPISSPDNDFEGVAFVGPCQANHIYVGVEGTTKPGGEPPTILEFDVVKEKFTGRKWKLGCIGYGGGSGVEAITFVPDNAATKVENGGFGGYFLASSQGDSKVYAYDLDSFGDGSELSKVGFVADRIAARLNGNTKYKISDFYYSPAGSTLYVTYDDEDTQQSISTYAKLGRRNDYVLQANTPLVNSGGVEAVTAAITENRRYFGAPITGSSDLYLGLDQGSINKYSNNCTGIKDTECGYCVPGAVGPRQGTSAKPAAGACENWIWSTSKCECGVVKECGGIENDQSCGWCQSTSQAMPGTSDGPATGACTNWIWSHRNCKCASLKACSGIADAAGCGWCESWGQAAPGTVSGPSKGSCENWIGVVSDCNCSGIRTCAGIADNPNCGWCPLTGQAMPILRPDPKSCPNLITSANQCPKPVESCMTGY